ncbi:MAG: dihydrodipicolinate synthase family protein [Acidobacteriaceae bacterium]|nr:dihydrodipicolinate synthase family protein [Acidobacteriaceae bacterium]MBV9780914.1 dihydrodipicolinate synthase family protein [Acidobacteriaceae bacterium]
MQWRGVMPALTTAFSQDLNVDLDFIGRHSNWLVDNGCTGIVALGSLGEGATLAAAEKRDILSTCVRAVGSRVPVIAGISALTTQDAVTLAKTAEDTGCAGLMVLPPYVYVGDWREMKAHVTAVFKATPLSCMLYNNPIAYTVDFLATQVKELVEENGNLHAIKESSADVRRVTALRALLGERLDVLMGVDDAIVESVAVGAVGWIAGLVNAFPRESVALFEMAKNGRTSEAIELYRWFLPLLRMDTVPKFVQLIKLVQQEAGVGSARVRPPRLELTGAEFDEARAIISDALSTRPKHASSTAFRQSTEAAAVR